MLAEPAEIAGEAYLVVQAYLLVAKEEDLVARKRVVQLLHLFVGKRAGQVEGADLGTNVGTRRRGADALVAYALGNGGDLGDLRQMRGCTHGVTPTR